MANGATLKPHAYVLAVHDLPGSVAYFSDVLGFAKDWEDGDRWQPLVRDEVRLMLGRCPDALPPAELGDHSYFAFITTDNVDCLHQVFAEKGAIIRSAPQNKPWGWREMAIATPEGHRMMFAQWIG